MPPTIYFIDLLLPPSLKPSHHSTEGESTDIWQEIAPNQESNCALSAYLKQIKSNIFRMIRVIRNKSAWGLIGIGSNFDGLVDPYNSYATIDRFRDFAQDMAGFLQQPQDLIGYKDNQGGVISADKVKALMFGYSPEELVAKFSHLNLENFLEKYFNENYRGKAVTPPVT